MLEVIPYIDTVALFVSSAWLPANIIRDLRTANGSRSTGKRDVLVEPVICAKTNGAIAYKIFVHQPNISVLALFEMLLARHDRIALHQVHIAVDFVVTTSRDQMVLLDWLRRHAILRWTSSRARMFREEDVTSWISKAGRSALGRKRATGREFIIYPDTCRVTRESYAVHAELRFCNARAVRSLRFEDTVALSRLDPSAVFDRHVKLVAFTPNYEELVSKIVREEVSHDRLDHLEKLKSGSLRKSDSHPGFSDRYRARLSGRIRAGMNELTDHGAAQLVHDLLHPNERSIDMSILGIPNTLCFRG